MTRKPEVLFVDPAISDIPTILLGLRPEVEAILLDAKNPAARQMSAALHERQNLEAVHVISHGSPGRVSFAAGEWSAETLDRDAEDLASIGRALGEHGDLRLWSCDVGIGAEGRDFVARLARAARAHVAAATRKVGAAALGGAWALALCANVAAAGPPLTAAGVATYAGVFPTTVTSRGDGERLKFFGRWPAGAKAGTYFIVSNNSGKLEVLGKFTPQGMPGTFAISAPLPPGTYTVGPPAPGPGTIAVYKDGMRVVKLRERGPSKTSIPR